MKSNNLKDEFPSIPKDIHNMVKQEVDKQIKTATTTIGSPRKISYKKAIIIALAATMALGTTVFAGTQIYKWYMQEEGSYGLKAGFGAADTSSIPQDIPVLSIEANYLPAGMVPADNGESSKYYYEQHPYQGGISIITNVMDEEISPDNLPISDTYVTATENVTIQGHDGIYLEYQDSVNDEFSFNKKIYIAYPEYWQIIEMYVGKDVSKEEALKIAENMELIPTGKSTPLAESYSWSDRLKEEPIEDDEPLLTVSKEEMNNLHKIGDSFPLPSSAMTTEGEWSDSNAIQAKVSNVQITDDYSLLEDAYVDASMKEALDGNGKLLPNTISYETNGDGIEDLDEVIRSEEVSQKLAYVTVEYTNTGNVELKEVLIFSSFMGLTKSDNEYHFYNRALSDNDDRTKQISASSIGGFGEMDYYDIRGGERNNNYIPSIKPNETITIHFAKIVNEDELDKMYLNLDPSGGYLEFTKSGLQIGYIDISK